MIARLIALLLLLPTTLLAESGTSAADGQAQQLAEEAEARAAQRYQDCLLEAISKATPDTPAATLIGWCDPDGHNQKQQNEYALRGRLALEKLNEHNPFVLTPHRRNYLLPISYWSNPVSNNPLITDKELQHHEAKFQVSLKAPLLP